MIGVGVGSRERSSGFSPRLLGSVVQVWVEASLGFAPAQWDDLSGNARHLTQATSGRRPALATMDQGVGVCVAFDGIDDQISVGVLSIAQPYWILLAHRYTSQSGSRYFLCGGDYLHPGWVAGGYAFNVDCATPQSAGTMPTDAWHIVDVLHNGGSSVACVNGVAGSTFDPGSNACTGLGFGDAIGSTGFASLQKVYGAIVISGAPSAATKAAVRQYFAGKIGVTL